MRAPAVALLSGFIALMALAPVLAQSTPGAPAKGMAAAQTALLPPPPGAHHPDSRGSDARVASLPFEECQALIEEASETADEPPVSLVRTSDLIVVQLDASDGFVTIACNRADGTVTLTKRLAKAPQTAAAR